MSTKESAPVAVTAGDREALIAHAVQYGPQCRDCADEAGVCPATGIGCGDKRKAAAHIVDALLHGAKHGHCPPLSAALAQPRAEMPDRNVLIALARAWWAANMRDTHFKTATIGGDGRVKVYWQDADDSGSYTLPVDYIAALALQSPPAAKVDDDISLAEAARDLLDAYKRLGGPVAFRLDLWVCLEANLERLP